MNTPTYSQLVASRGTADTVSTFTFHLSDSASFNVRAILRDGGPWFVAADVCAALGHTNASKAVEDHVHAEDKANHSLGLPGRAPLVVNESGMYALIFGSRKEEAKPFKRWITSEVLPQIRKTGAYTTAAAAPKLLPIDLLEQAQALKTLLGDDELKRLAPLLWQEIADGAQNAMRCALGATLALPAPDAPKRLDVVEIAKAQGIALPQNLRSTAGKYVKARVVATETERLINGSIRRACAYADHAAVADALREYLAKRG